MVTAAKSPDSPTKPGTVKAEFLRLARDRFHASADAEARMRVEQLMDQRFMAGEQWPSNVKADRDTDGRPCLTSNRLPVFKRLITNQQRASKPAIQINPIDSQSDPKVAEVFQGIIRQIEIASNADIAYDTACDHQVTIGRGFFRLLVDWDDIDPWQQSIRIKRIKNPFTVFFDPSCQEADYSDARYAFIVEDVPMDEFKQRYKSVDPRTSDPFQTLGDRSSDWQPEGKIRIAEYFYVEVTDDKITLLSNDQEVPTESLSSDEMKQFMASEGVTIVRSRTIQKRAVKWAKITGTEILEENEWAGQWIPIIPVLGDELDINGEIDLKGMVRDARDPQRMYNYWISAQTETIALAPKAPYVGVEGQFEGHEKKWNLANRRSFPYLEYRNKSFSGTNAPPPQRQQLEPPIQAISMAIRQADNDLKATTGLYDASLGERGPEESGRAILARQHQGDTTTSHWVDNLMRSIRFLGRQLVDLVPKIYDAPRVLRILGQDNQPSMVMVHSGNAEQAQAQAASQAQEAGQKGPLPDGVRGIYDLGAGRFDVTVSVGPSYQSRRQEAVEALLSFLQAFPPAAPAIGDVLAENMDWPGASIVAKRLRKMVPPQLLDDPTGQPTVEDLQGQMTKAQQALQMMQQELQQAHQIIQTDQVKASSAEKIAQMEGQIKLALADKEAALKVKLAMMDAQLSDGTVTPEDQSLDHVQLAVDTQHQVADRDTERMKMQMDHQQALEREQTARKKIDADTALGYAKLGHESTMLDDEQTFEAEQQKRDHTHVTKIEGQKAKTQTQIAKTKSVLARAKKPGGK